MALVNIIVGDYSHDGHGVTNIFQIQSNLTGDEIKEAYKIGVKLLGVDFINKYCNDYEDSAVPVSLIRKLIDMGLDPDDVDFDEGKLVEDEFINEFEKDLHQITSDMFTIIYLFICSLGNPDFIWFFDENLDEVTIGGYGFFY